MNRSYLRLISYFSLFLIIILFKFYSNLNDNVIFSIALVMLFLIIFTFIFKNEGSPGLKIFIIIFSLIVLPLFVMAYIGVFNYFSNPLPAILMALAVVICGVVSVIVMYKLDYAELKWE